MRPAPAWTDGKLLEAVQRGCFRYFWDHGHPVSHLSRDRSTRDVVTIGGTGMGLMCMIAAAENGWKPRAAIAERIGIMLQALEAAEHHHGVWGHFIEGASGHILPFSDKDDGADLVETAFLAMALLCLRQYFTKRSRRETEIRNRADRLWRRIDWTAHLRDGHEALFWHWSPRHGFAMNMPIVGWNECLIVYVLAAASPTHRVPLGAYHNGWTSGRDFINGKRFHGIDLPLGPTSGGPLFFSHYSFLGLDPRGLSDRYADYWTQNLHHTLINRAHCIANPKGYVGYGENCWGLTASDSTVGYAAHAPDNDLGVIAPTAALSAMPYTPERSLATLRHLLEAHPKLWGPWGFRDAFCPDGSWMADTVLAIDQGPIIAMIENHRSGLLWSLFMSAPEIRPALDDLGFAPPAIA